MVLPMILTPSIGISLNQLKARETGRQNGHRLQFGVHMIGWLTTTIAESVLPLKWKGLSTALSPYFPENQHLEIINLEMFSRGLHYQFLHWCSWFCQLQALHSCIWQESYFVTCTFNICNHNIEAKSSQYLINQAFPCHFEKSNQMISFNVNSKIVDMALLL